MGMLMHRHSVDANVTMAQSLGVEPKVAETKTEEVEVKTETEKKKPGRKPKAE